MNESKDESNMTIKRNYSSYNAHNSDVLPRSWLVRLGRDIVKWIMLFSCTDGGLWSKHTHITACICTHATSPTTFLSHPHKPQFSWSWFSPDSPKRDSPKKIVLRIFNYILVRTFCYCNSEQYAELGYLFYGIRVKRAKNAKTFAHAVK